MDIISRAEWGARAPRSRQTVSWSQRREVIVHYSEGPTSQSVRSIQDFHLDGRGWGDVGYNFLVDVHGRVYEGRGWLVVGAHAPDHNSSGIGVCMIGRDGDATDAAKRAIRWLYDEACRRAERRLAMRGHRDVYNTDCPGDELYAWVRAGMPIAQPKPYSGGAPKEETEDMTHYHGQLRDGAGAITPISIAAGAVSAIGFLCDNDLVKAPPPVLRVAMHDVKTGWHTKTVTVDSTKPKPWLKVAGTVDGFSIRREDDGAVPVAWDAH